MNGAGRGARKLTRTPSAMNTSRSSPNSRQGAENN